MIPPFGTTSLIFQGAKKHLRYIRRLLAAALIEICTIFVEFLCSMSCCSSREVTWKAVRRYTWLELSPKVELLSACTYFVRAEHFTIDSLNYLGTLWDLCFWDIIAYYKRAKLKWDTIKQSGVQIIFHLFCTFEYVAKLGTYCNCYGKFRGKLGRRWQGTPICFFLANLPTPPHKYNLGIHQ